MSPENNLITLQVERELINLFKFYLEVLEEVEPDKEKYAVLRKKVLGRSNDSIRQLSQFLEYFDFQINNQKLEEALKNNRASYKKIIIGSLISVE